MAACAISYVARGERPGTTAALVSIPTLFNVLFHVAGVVVLAISVMMYGF